MISDQTRKNITNAALFYVILSIISAFAGNFTDTAIMSISFAIDIISLFCVLWLAYGIRMLYMEESTNNLKYSFLLVGIAAITEIIGTIAYLIANSTFSDNKMLLIGSKISLALAFLLFIPGYWLLKNQLDIYFRERRNLFKGQISLPMGYFLRFVFTVMDIIKPLNELLVKTDEGVKIVPGWESYFIAVSFFQISYIFFVIIGYWNLRRTMLVLDRVPTSYLQLAKKPTPVYKQPPYSLEVKDTGGGNSINSEQKLVNHDIPSTPIAAQKGANNEQRKKKMFCIKCGLELDPDSKFCPYCGAKNPYIDENK